MRDSKPCIILFMKKKQLETYSITIFELKSEISYFILDIKSVHYSVRI